MQANGQNNQVGKPKIGFWQRQFQPQATSAQKVFDWILGVVLPVICFVFDPIVFKGNGALFGDLKPFAYILSFVSVLAMSAWLIWGTRLKWLNGFLAGLFFGGAFVSFCVGVLLFPYSFAGMLILIGFLGYTPLLTALVYLRNGLRAMDASKLFLVKSVRVYAVAFGAIFSVSLAWTVNSEIKKSLRNIEVGSAEVVYAEGQKLKWVAPLVNFGKLVLVYQRSTPAEPWQQEKMQAIAEVYKELTGEGIENKSRAWLD